MLQPTTPDQREGIYEDVLKLIAPGIISHNIRIGRVTVSLRSLNPGDLYVLQARTDSVTTEREWRSWFIAGSVWMVDGEIVIGNQAAQRLIYKTLLSLPNYVVRSLYYQAFGLMRRVHDAADLIEAFCYEANSRYLWKQIGDRFDRSGIPGLETTGLNVIQRVWAAINSSEDERVATRQAWECAKLVASTQAYKSIKRMSQTEQTQLNYEDQRRQEVKDRAYWKAKGFLVDTPEFQERNPHLRTKSADELMDEYKRWVSGEQDWHDQVVAEYKAKIKRAMEAEAERIRSLNEEYDREISALGMPDSAPGIVGYTPEQVQGILERANRSGAMRGARHVPNDDGKFRNFERFIRPKEVPSSLSFNDIFQSKSDGPSLDERIADRKVKLDPRERE